MSKEILYIIMVACGVGSIIALGYALYQLYKTKMNKEEQYWEQKGYDDKIDNISECYTSIKYQNSYRLGQWRAYEATKSFNKPKRGGSKKFYVYVKSPKGNVKKVSFGDTGLSVKFKPKQR